LKVEKKSESNLASQTTKAERDELVELEKAALERSGREETVLAVR